MPIQRVLFLALLVFMIFALKATADRVDSLEAECLSPPYTSAANESEELIGSLVLWLQSALAPYPDLLMELGKDGPEICLAEKIFDAQGYFGADDNRIVIRRDLPMGLMRAVAIHELRHVQQLRAGACPGPSLSMQQHARVTLALEADASAVSLAIAWDLKEKGDAEVWEALFSWPKHADLVPAFNAALLETNDTARATARAFAQWYASDWRRETYYVAACMTYLDRQEEKHINPLYDAAPPGFLEYLCHMPDGEPYPCTEPSFARGNETKQAK